MRHARSLLVMVSTTLAALILVSAAPAQAAPTVYFDNWRVMGYSREGALRHFQNMVDELKLLTGDSSITYVQTEVHETSDANVRRCTAPNLCVTYTNELQPASGAGGITVPGPASGASASRFSKVYVRALTDLIKHVQGERYLSRDGQVFKNTAMHEFGHQMLMYDDNFTTAGKYSYMLGNAYQDCRVGTDACPFTRAMTWTSTQITAMKAHFNRLPTSTCGSRCGGPGYEAPEVSQPSVTFAPPWGSPYTNHLIQDVPWNPGCTGPFRISFDYDFETNYDWGHFQRLDTGEILQFTGQGSYSTVMTSTTHWAAFTDYSIVAPGFTNIRAVCF